jgi:hypothetical protein
VRKRGVGENHLSYSAGGGDLIDIGEAVVELGIRRLRIPRDELIEELERALEVLDAALFWVDSSSISQDCLPVLTAVADIVGIRRQRGLQQIERALPVAPGEGLHSQIERLLGRRTGRTRQGQ